MPDPEAAPLNITQLVTLLNTLVSSTIFGSYIPYVIQHSEPGPDDRDKAWIFTDTQGRPVEIRIWWDNSGAWRRVYNGMLGEVRMYNGDPSVDFDTDGLGKVGETYDGWHLCNGRDGTPDLSDRFMIAGHMNNAGGHVGYDDGWQTAISNVDDEKTGGNRDITLTDETTWQPARPAITARRHTADGNAPDASGVLLGTGTAATQITLNGGEAVEGRSDPDAISIIPPFIAIGYIIFVGYSA